MPFLLMATRLKIYSHVSWTEAASEQQKYEKMSATQRKSTFEEDGNVFSFR